MIIIARGQEVEHYEWQCRTCGSMIRAEAAESIGSPFDWVKTFACPACSTFYKVPRQFKPAPGTLPAPAKPLPPEVVMD